MLMSFDQASLLKTLQECPEELKDAGKAAVQYLARLVVIAKHPRYTLLPALRPFLPDSSKSSMRRSTFGHPVPPLPYGEHVDFFNTYFEIRLLQDKGVRVSLVDYTKDIWKYHPEYQQFVKDAGKNGKPGTNGEIKAALAQLRVKVFGDNNLPPIEPLSQHPVHYDLDPYVKDAKVGKFYEGTSPRTATNQGTPASTPNSKPAPPPKGVTFSEPPTQDPSTDDDFAAACQASLHTDWQHKRNVIQGKITSINFTIHNGGLTQEDADAYYVQLTQLQREMQAHMATEPNSSGLPASLPTQAQRNLFSGQGSNAGKKPAAKSIKKMNLDAFLKKFN